MLPNDRPSRASHNAPRTNIGSLVSLLLVCCIPGCAGWSGGLPDVKPMREERAAKAMAVYEQHRDEAQCLAADSNLRQGDVDGCIDLLDRLLARNPKHREGQLLRINAALAQENYTDAKRRAEALLAQLPDDPAALHTSGMVCDALGEDALATDYFRRAAAKEPDNALYAASYASTESADEGSHYQQFATNDAAKDATNDAKKPADEAALWRSELLKAELCLGLGDRPEALRLTNELLSADEQNREAQELLDRLQHPGTGARKGSEKRPAVRSGRGVRTVSFERSVGTARKPAKPQNHANDRLTAVGHEAPQRTDSLKPGLAALDAGARDRAADALSKALAEAPQDEKLATTAALAALKHDQPLLAAQLAQQALDSLPRSAGLYRISGTAQYRLGQWAAARDALEQSLALDNTHPLSYFLLGSALQKLGESEAAQRNFKRASEIDPRYASQP